MPITVQSRSITGLLVETKQSLLSRPLLYVPAEDGIDHIRNFCIFGYIRSDRVYIHSLKVQVSYHADTGLGLEKMYILDKNLVDETTDKQVSHPATWVKDTSEIDENQFYQLVVNPAGLFTLVRIESFKHIPGLPDTPPTHREYTKTFMAGIQKY